eukprot:14685219-Alexandrium_andersonii.AAC.1
MVIVDPAGLRHIQQHGPQGAGGAAGHIYEWLGIGSFGAFPGQVKSAISRPLLAKYCEYGER